VAAYAQGDHAVVEIRDNGPGMTDSFIQDQLFRPFASTKSTGYGIGMYQTRETIHKWGGHLDLQSEIDVGTTVRVLIPLADNAHSIRPLGEPGCP
jgi:signal transduction histidine kinase